MEKRLYPCPSYEGVDDLGDDIYTVFFAWYDEQLDGFPTEQPVDYRSAVFFGSYDECCDYIEKHSPPDSQ